MNHVKGYKKEEEDIHGKWEKLHHPKDQVYVFLRLDPIEKGGSDDLSKGVRAGGIVGSFYFCYK